MPQQTPRHLLVAPSEVGRRRKREEASPAQQRTPPQRPSPRHSEDASPAQQTIPAMSTPELIRSSSRSGSLFQSGSETGYNNVYQHGRGRYRVAVPTGPKGARKRAYIGTYDSIEDAAAAFARYEAADRERVVAERLALQEAAAEKAIEEAAAEGLTLVRSDRNATGFEGVYKAQKHLRRRRGDSICDPRLVTYRARGLGQRLKLAGNYDAAEQAALALARYEARRERDPSLPALHRKLGRPIHPGSKH